MKTLLVSVISIFLFLNSHSQNTNLSKCDTLKTETILHEHVPVLIKEHQITKDGTYKLSINGNIRPASKGNRDWWMEFTIKMIVNDQQEILFRKGQLITSNNANFKLSDVHSITSVLHANDRIVLSLTIDRSMVDGINDHEDTQMDRESIICLQRVL